MLKNFMIPIFTILIFYSGISFASVECTMCANNTVNTNVTDDLSQGENEVGAQKSSANITTGSFPISINVNQKVYVNEWFVYSGESIPPAGTSNATLSFRKVDDYISMALRYVSNCGIQSFAPFNVAVLTQGACYQQSYTSSTVGDYWYPRVFQTSIRIDKKIVSGTYSKNIFVGEYGICMNAGNTCRSKDAVFARVYLNVNITAHQKCTLNAGQVINIDFGNISSGAFTAAGARPEGVNDIVRNVNVSCDNIAPNTAMTLRLQADKVSGKAVVTNTNNDVGFVVADGNGTALTPNNLSSVIPFNLGSDNKSSVTIRVYPVSVTGNKPAEGPVTSQAYLRVDFA